MKRKISAYIELLRPYNCIMAAAGVLLGYWLSIARFDFALPALLATASAFFVCGGGQAVNDYFDRAVDARYKKHRPIPSGRISAPAAFSYALSLFLIGLILAVLVNDEVFVIAVFASIFLLSYSAALLKYKFVGNWVVAFFTGLTFVYGGAVSGSYALPLMVGAVALLANVGREITKDLEDVKADKGFKRSLPMLVGAEGSKAAAFAAYVLAIAIAIIPYGAGIITEAAFMLLLLVSFGIFGISITQLAADDYVESQKTSKFAMAIALFAYFLALF
ncbi:MAG: UbiA family prenyltransferase [Candidatus Micrarchaeota archaeon]